MPEQMTARLYSSYGEGKEWFLVTYEGRLVWQGTREGCVAAANSRNIQIDSVEN